MDNFDLYKISTAKLAGKSCNTDCLFCISGAGRIRKKRNILRNIVQNVRKSTLICTTQGKCYDLSSCFFNTCFYKLQGKFSGTKDKTGSKLMASQDQFVFICVCCCHFLCPPFFMSVCRKYFHRFITSAFFCQIILHLHFFSNLSVSYCRGIYT